VGSAEPVSMECSTSLNSPMSRSFFENTLSFCFNNSFNPIPLIDECIDSLAGNKWFSKLDANSAYYQVKMKEEDKQKTAFITKYGLFQFTNVVSFVQNSHFTGFNLIPYCRNRSNTLSKFSMWDSKSFPITNISSKKWNQIKTSKV
jgi:hypothetical protein